MQVAAICGKDADLGYLIQKGGLFNQGKWVNMIVPLGAVSVDFLTPER